MSELPYDYAVVASGPASTPGRRTGHCSECGRTVSWSPRADQDGPGVPKVCVDGAYRLAGVDREN